MKFLKFLKNNIYIPIIFVLCFLFFLSFAIDLSFGLIISTAIVSLIITTFLTLIILAIKFLIFLMKDTK